jgi:hypothetical protein
MEGIEKLSALPSGRGLPDANPGEHGSEHNQSERTKQGQLINDASGIQGFVFSSQPVSLTERQGMGNPFAWRQILIHAKYHEMIKKKRGEIECSANRQNKPRQF